MVKILKNNIDNYTLFQLVLPLNLEINFNKVDEVVTLYDIIKGVDLKKHFIGRPFTNRVAILKTILFGIMIGTRKLK